jgi:perosamine synthetase
MQVPKIIPHNRPTLGVEEQEAAVRVLSSGWLAQGYEVASFENEFCDFLGLPHEHAVAVTSGTSALYLALWVLAAKGKKIGFPAYVCSSLRNAVGLVQAEEMLVDNSLNSPNIDIDCLNSVAADIAIVPHMYGLPVDVEKVKCKYIIEDCCQALGAKINGINVGLSGDVGIYSFYATKLITSGGQGGMIVSKNKSIIDEIRDFREFDLRNDNKLRFNFQMTDLQAAVGRVQLMKFNSFLERRNNIYNAYLNSGFTLLDSDLANTSPVRYRSVLLTNEPYKIKDSLESVGVKTIIPIEEKELLGDKDHFVNAQKFTNSTLSLPCYPGLSDDGLDFIIKNLSKLV